MREQEKSYEKKLTSLEWELKLRDQEIKGLEKDLSKTERHCAELAAKNHERVKRSE